MQYVFYCYHRKDDNMLETCINSLRQVNSSVQILVVTDAMPPAVRDHFRDQYGVQWILVPFSQMQKRRATCKIECLEEAVHEMPEGAQVLVSDVDVYYLKDPFRAFDIHTQMDLGLTTRGYQHLFPINAGIFYLHIQKSLREWLLWHRQQILRPTWEPYVQLRHTYHHERYGLDWSVGQDFLIANWLHRSEVFQERLVRIEDVGAQYNYCPPTDTMGAAAFEMVRRVLRDQTVNTIHLKSDLKRMIYEPGLFPHACLRYAKGVVSWM